MAYLLLGGAVACAVHAHKPRTAGRFTHTMRSRSRGIVNKHTAHKLAAHMVDLLTVLSQALSAGLSLAQAFEMAAHEMPDPMGRELKDLMARVKVGCPLEEALGEWASRRPLEDLRILADAVLVLKKTGGNLVETFARMAVTIRERTKVQGRIRVLTAQGVAQGVVLCAMPLVLGCALYAIAPEYVAPLIATAPGRKMMCVGVIMEVLGAWWMKTIVTIRV